VAVFADGTRTYGIEKVLLSHYIASRDKDYGLNFRYVCLQRGPLYEHLREANADVYVIEEKVPYTYPPNIAKLCGILLSHFWSSVRIFRHIRSYLKETRPDLVYTHEVTFQIIAGVAAKSCGIKSVGHFHRLLNKKHYWGLSRILLCLVLNACLDMGIAISNAVRESLWGQMRAKTRCLYNSIDVEFIRRRAEQLSSSGNCLKADVVSVGRLVTIKKYEILIEALSILAQEGLHPKLAIVGGPADQTNSYYLRLKDQVAGLGLSDYVFFTDYVPEPYGIIANADASVLCCTNEGFGLVVLESMACRTAVIVADAGGPTELVEHDKDGLKFSDDNPAELAKCLRMLLLDKSRAHRLADQAYKKAAKDFDIDSHMRSLNRNFLAVLGRY